MTITVHCQIHFTKYKSPTYKTATIQYGSSFEDSTKLDVIRFNHIPEMKGIKIHLVQVTNDSSKILIYKNEKLIQTIPLPFMFWFLENDCLIADLDKNKKLDIKLTIEGHGSGLAGELAYKIYLFNEGTKFKLFSFFDFSHEKEYDINGDGIFEILSCDHVLKGGHSYWVYNTYNFINGKPKNISKVFNYPLWTKHLNKSRNVIATHISQQDRYKEFKNLPNGAFIK